MASFDSGMIEVCDWIRRRFPIESKILDVGACDGKWSDWLRDYPHMDAVEIFAPYVEEHKLEEKYENVFVSDVEDLKYEYYDLVIFGDVIEHMSVEKAQKVLEYAKSHCEDMIVAVPYLYPQGPYNNNEYERHIQDDLDEKTFDERYPGFEILSHPEWNYAYYHYVGNEQDDK